MAESQPYIGLSKTTMVGNYGLLPRNIKIFEIIFYNVSLIVDLIFKKSCVYLIPQKSSLQILCSKLTMFRCVTVNLCFACWLSFLSTRCVNLMLCGKLLLRFGLVPCIAMLKMRRESSNIPSDAM